MESCLHIVGLGPGGIEQITLGNYRLLLRVNKVFVRTSVHPCVQDLLAEGVSIESFDAYYGEEASFEAVYTKIVDHLKKELDQSSEVIYAVPGHPLVAERTVSIILEKLASQYKIILHPAVSFLDEIFRVIPFDPVEGFKLCNYDKLRESDITGREWLIIPQVYSKLIASEVKLDLMNYYPDEAEVIIVQRLGLSDQAVVRVPLFEMDHLEFDHLTTVVMPKHENVPSLLKLTEIMAILRAPEGCPWDREQTHESLKKYLIEESYEVIDAIENQDMYNLCEELGDLLLQVVFHAQVAVEAEEFELQDILKGIIEKLIRRHPHVFGEGKAETAGEVIQTWDQIKKEEKQEAGIETKDYFGKAKGLPALMWADWTQKKAAKVGFDWPELEGPMAKIKEELTELEEALVTGRGISEELGDLLFAIVNLSRFLKLDAEEVLRFTIRKFQNRFLHMARLAEAEGKDFEKLSLDQMDFYWEKAKLQEKSGKV